MKKLLLLSVSFLFFCCSSDDGGNDVPLGLPMLAGKWKHVSTGWLVNGEEQDMTEPATTPCNLPYGINYLDTGIIQAFGCNPYETPVKVIEHSGTWTVVDNGNAKDIIHHFPANTEMDVTATIKQLDSENLKTYIITYWGAVRVNHYKRVE